MTGDERMVLPAGAGGTEHQGVWAVVVDDEPDFARGLARLLAGRFPDVRVAAVHSGREALAVLAEREAHLLVTDLRMPEMSGMQLLEAVLARHPDLSVVVLTAHGTIETAVEALHAGAYDFLTKPVEPDQLFRVAAKALERSRLLAENDRLRQMVSRRDNRTALVGEGPAMQRLHRTIAAVAQSDYTVLIRGESGTGKELAARLIHESGPRAARPFLAVNCPAIPENLLESELFGHVRGAFTGADRDRKGLFAAAESGTLHLDEIGDISPAMQTKLLRCLQNGEIRPVGASDPQGVNVRVIASTNQDLEARLRARTFREDLYYRLNVMPIQLPPLRERLEDIPDLARFLLQKLSQKQGRELKISDGAIRLLVGYSWPGNVRELENCLERASIMCETGLIDRDVILFNNQEQRPAPTAHSGRPAPLVHEADEDLDERQRLIAALERCGWVQAKAARLLGMTPRQIAYRIQIMNINMRRI